MTPPSTRTPEPSSQGARTLWHAANQDLLREGYFERSELRSDFAAAPFAEIDGLSPSGLRNFANKLTFVPAGHAYREWHETGAPLRVTYLYLDPTKLQQLRDTDAAYAPRAFFE